MLRCFFNQISVILVEGESMKKVLIIVILSLVLVACSKNDDVAKKQSSETETTIKPNTKASTSTQTSTSKETSTTTKALSQEEVYKIKADEILEEIKKEKEINFDTPKFKVFIDDFNNDDSMNAIIVSNNPQNEVFVFYLDLEKNTLEEQLLDYTYYDNFANLHAEIVNIESFAEPFLYLYNADEPGFASNRASLLKIDKDRILENVSKNSPADESVLHLNEWNDDGFYDAYTENYFEKLMLGESVAIQKVFSDGEIFFERATVTLEDKPTSAIEVVKKYIRLSYLKSLLKLEYDAYESNIDTIIYDMLATEDVGDYYAWNKDIVEDMFADEKIIGFELGEERDNDYGSKSVEIKTFVKDTYYSKSLGLFDEGKTVTYELRGEEGDWTIVGHRLEDATWEGMDTMYKAEFLPLRNTICYYDVSGSKSSELDTATLEMFANDMNESYVAVFMNINFEYVFIEEITCFDKYFMEKDGKLYLLSQDAFYNFKESGELSDDYIILITDTLDENMGSIDGYESNSVKIDGDYYTCEIVSEGGSYEILKWKKGKGLVEYKAVSANDDVAIDMKFNKSEKLEEEW